MPELPEVETIARGVHERVRGDRIVQAWFGRFRSLSKHRREHQAKGLEGRVVLAVHRDGKAYCRASWAAGKASWTPDEAASQWIVHLGMTGRLLVTTPDGPVAAHTHARLSLASGRELRFVDPRRFGRLEFRDLAERGLRRAGRGAADHRGGGVCRAVSAGGSFRSRRRC